MSDADHLDYLKVVLFSFGIVPEDQFDKLAVEHLRSYRATALLKPLKEKLILVEHVYRLTLRGKAYLAFFRYARPEDAPTMTPRDAAALLDKLAMLADQTEPKPKKTEYW